MAKMTGRQIEDLARRIISENPSGIRYGELFRQIAKTTPETPVNTINGSIWDLHVKFPEAITKPSRGLFVPINGTGHRAISETPAKLKEKFGEKDFYETFKNWLKEGLDEVTKAVVLGGSGLRDKWWTPDIIGIYKKSASDLISFEPEIVSAEVKTNSAEAITAFGQAISYRLFSHKTYVVMTNAVGKDDASKLESLCLLFGIGLVLFEPEPKNPEYEIRVRAQRFVPDMFYVNDFARKLNQHNHEKFEELFG